MRGIGRRIAWLMACLLLTGAGAAQAEGDPEKGAKVFNKCKACHAADEAKNKIRPHLVGIFGRTAGSVEGFKYSDAMKSAGIVWEDDTIAAYLEEPKADIPGNRMAFVGLRKDAEIADLLAYLHEEARGWALRCVRATSGRLIRVPRCAAASAAAPTALLTLGSMPWAGSNSARLPPKRAHRRRRGPGCRSR